MLVSCVKIQAQTSDTHNIVMTECDSEKSDEKIDLSSRGKRTTPIVCEISSTGIKIDNIEDEIILFEIYEENRDSQVIFFFDDVQCASWILNHNQNCRLVVRTYETSYEGWVNY